MLPAGNPTLAAISTLSQVNHQNTFKLSCVLHVLPSCREHLNPQREIDQAVAAAEAAAAAGATHIIWSALEDTRPLLQGGEDVPVVSEDYKVGLRACASSTMRIKQLVSEEGLII